ncbi:MAG: hypothetical protein OEQ29_04935 [Alphaproteobacteria bacterium]|nr:hypothetical protein [Alphaproteobacteria bacterium]
MQTHRPGAHKTVLPKSVLYWLAMLALTMFSAQAGAGELDHSGSDRSARAGALDQLAQVCAPVGQRACGFKNGRWRNYRNRCYARRDNATPIRSGRCNAAPNCSTQPVRPVCGTWRGRRVNFRNFCFARRARATDIRAGRCSSGACNDTRPVCGWWRGRRYNFANICQLRRRNARFIQYGRCRAQPPRTCHQRATSRRYPHIQGRSWHPACRTPPPPRTCHQRSTSQRYPHIQGRSWNPACRATDGGGGGGGATKPKAGSPCTGRDQNGIAFQGRIFIDNNGFPVCMGDSSGQPRR